MTAEILSDILKDIPADTNIESDSGWECNPTSVGMIVFSETAKVLIMCQTESVACEQIRKRLEDYNEMYDVVDFTLLYNGE